MKKYIIFILVFVLTLSAGFNLYQYRDMKRAQAQLTIVNSRVLDNIEQYTRWSIRFINEMQEEKGRDHGDGFMNETLFAHLRNSLDDLEEYFAYFVDLQEKEEEEKSVCAETLESLRSIRNVVNHNLQEKFELNEQLLTANDYVFLRDLEVELQLFLTNIYDIAESNENQQIIEISSQQEEKLREISNNFVELGSRYRHSVLLEKEEDLLSQEEAQSRLKEIAADWVDDEALEDIEIEGIQYRNGIGHYALETEGLLVWLDAKVGTLRYLEYKPQEATEGKESPKEVENSEESSEIPRHKALEIAEDFYVKFQGANFDELVKEVFVFPSEHTGESVYAFRFTPKENGLRLSSDAFEINISADTGKVLRYRNRYNETVVPATAKGDLSVLEFTTKDEDDLPLSAEEIIKEYEEEFQNLDYQGRAVIRNYYTEYAPRVVKVFFAEIDGQRAALYFDEYTAQELERTYYPFEPF